VGKTIGVDDSNCGRQLLNDVVGVVSDPAVGVESQGGVATAARQLAMLDQLTNGGMQHLVQNANANIKMDRAVNEAGLLHQIQASMAVDSGPSPNFQRSRPMAKTELRDFQSQILQLANSGNKDPNPAPRSGPSGRTASTSRMGQKKDIVTSSSGAAGYQDVLNVDDADRPTLLSLLNRNSYGQVSGN